MGSGFSTANYTISIGCSFARLHTDVTSAQLNGSTPTPPMRGYWLGVQTFVCQDRWGHSVNRGALSHSVKSPKHLNYYTLYNLYNFCRGQWAIPPFFFLNNKYKKKLTKWLQFECHSSKANTKAWLICLGLCICECVVTQVSLYYTHKTRGHKVNQMKSSHFTVEWMEKLIGSKKSYHTMH